MKLLIASLLLIALASSCNKDEECESYKPAQDIAIDTSLNQFKFKESTYWVYKSDNSGQIDSQRVVSAGSNDFQGEYPSKCSGGTFVREHEMIVHSYMSYADYQYILIGAGWYKKNVTTSDRHLGRLIYSGKNSYSEESGDVLMETIPSLTLNGNEFTNVKKIWIKVLPPSSVYPNIDSYDEYMYFADGVGLIKWEVFEGSNVFDSWSIKSWNIVL